MRILVLICLLTISFCNVQAQVRDQELTDRLDADFKRWLWIKRIIADTAKVMQSEVAQVKKMKLTTSSVLAPSLRGLAYFTGLEELELNVTSQRDSIELDLSANKALKRLICVAFCLRTLNLRQCKELKELKCYAILLDTLDISQNLKLEKCSYVFWGDSGLCYLMLPAEPCQLRELSCCGISMKKLEVKNCPHLRTLNIASRTLSSLCVDNCVQLDSLSCHDGILEELNVGNCTALRYLDCSFNRIRELDLSRNTGLTTVLLQKQEARYLLNENGRTGKLRRLVLPRNNAGGEGLRCLDCSDNGISELDISGCTGLQQLNCSFNNLKELNTSCNPELAELDCGYNFIGALDLSANLKLQKVRCGGQGYKWMKKEGEDYRLLKKLLLPLQGENQQGKRLKELDYESTELEIPVRLERYPELRGLNCSDCGLKKLKLHRNRELRILDCSHNPMRKLSLGANRNLTTLNIRLMPLCKLDLKRNTLLERLQCRVEEKNELLLILSKDIDLESVSFDTDTYEEELLKKR